MHKQPQQRERERKKQQQRILSSAAWESVNSCCCCSSFARSLHACTHTHTQRLAALRSLSLSVTVALLARNNIPADASHVVGVGCCCLFVTGRCTADTHTHTHTQAHAHINVLLVCSDTCRPRRVVDVDCRWTFVRKEHGCSLSLSHSVRAFVCVRVPADRLWLWLRPYADIYFTLFSLHCLSKEARSPSNRNMFALC